GDRGGVGMVEGGAGGGGDGQVGAVVVGEDARTRRNLDRLPGNNRASRRAHQPFPECASPRMLCAPRADDCFNVVVAANVLVFGNAAPGADRSTESAGKLGALSQLALGRGDLADRQALVQDAMGE